MLTADQYAASIIDKYRVVVDTDSSSHRAADELVPLLKKWGSQYLQGITLSGAYAGNSAVRLSSDVDILVALKPLPDRDIKNVFWGLFEFLSDHIKQIHTRTVSIRAETRDFKVDLIPAFRDHGLVLFNKKSGHEVRTDLTRHVHLIANSGRQEEICALKIWRERQQLEFPSFYLELTVLNALESERYGRLADNVRTILRYIGNRLEQAVVRDPANDDNIVSNDLTAAEKKAVAKAARDALYDENWKKILW